MQMSVSSSKGIINSTPFINGDPIDLLKKSPALRARVRNMAAHASFHVMSSKIIYEQSEDLQQMIKSKLEAM